MSHEAKQSTPERCAHCHSELTKAPSGGDGYILVCFNHKCSQYRRPQGGVRNRTPMMGMPFTGYSQGER